MMHKQGSVGGFTKRYKIRRLVYYEIFGSLAEAHQREKQLKGWKRLWKIRLIEEMNPEWIDLLDKTEGILPVAPGGQVDEPL